jgi:hypothetical protein
MVTVRPLVESLVVVFPQMHFLLAVRFLFVVAAFDSIYIGADVPPRTP